jgi:hypothetical protein
MMDAEWVSPASSLALRVMVLGPALRISWEVCWTPFTDQVTAIEAWFVYVPSSGEWKRMIGPLETLIRFVTTVSLPSLSRA